MFGTVRPCIEAMPTAPAGKPNALTGLNRLRTLSSLRRRNHGTIGIASRRDKDPVWLHPSRIYPNIAGWFDSHDPKGSGRTTPPSRTSPAHQRSDPVLAPTKADDPSRRSLFALSSKPIHPGACRKVINVKRSTLSDLVQTGG